MELMLRRSVVDVGVKEKKWIEVNEMEEDGGLIEMASTMNSKERLLTSAISGSLTPAQNDEIRQLESAKAEIDEARAENERLKTLLSRIMKDYESLQMQFYNLVQDQNNKPRKLSVLENGGPEELLSLSLGRTTTETRMEKMAKKSSKVIADNDQLKGISLGLDFKLEETNQNTAHSCEENEDEGSKQPWPPNKDLKSPRPGDNEESEQIHVKKARVSVKARCDSANMKDGCQWRKYGQKMCKGNPCPRAYYRCTVAPGCPVRKQVQRCAEDMTVFITTYEGTHNHPLPASAAAMASTTSAAATTLTQISGSSPSRQTTSFAGLQGLDFNWSSSTLRQNQFYFPNPSDSSFLTHPAITLDLTSPSSSAVSSTPRTRSPSPYFNFCSSDFSSQATHAWRSTSNMSYLSWGGQTPYNKTELDRSFSLGWQCD